MGQEKKGRTKTSNRKGHLAAVKPSPNVTKNRAPGDFSVLGTKHEEVGLQFLIQSMGALGIDRDSSQQDINSAMARVFWTLKRIKPKNELEAMIAVQMAGVHNAAMELMRQGMSLKQCAEGVDRNINLAAKLMDLFLNQVGALQKMRGQGSQQRVVVEHVHVYPGGQAIVGTVTPGGEGEGPPGQFFNEAGRFPLTLLALPHIRDYPLGSVAHEISRGNFSRCQYYQSGAEIINESVKEADRILRHHQMGAIRKNL